MSFSEIWIPVGLQASLMVHPDKCSHERAKEAFEVLNSANNDLQNEMRRREVIHVLNMAKGEEELHPTCACPLSLRMPIYGKYK